MHKVIFGEQNAWRLFFVKKSKALWYGFQCQTLGIETVLLQPSFRRLSPLVMTGILSSTFVCSNFCVFLLIKHQLLCVPFFLSGSVRLASGKFLRIFYACVHFPTNTLKFVKILYFSVFIFIHYSIFYCTLELLISICCFFFEKNIDMLFYV